MYFQLCGWWCRTVFLLSSLKIGEGEFILNEHIFLKWVGKYPPPAYVRGYWVPPFIPNFAKSFVGIPTVSWDRGLCCGSLDAFVVVWWRESTVWNKNNTETKFWNTSFGQVASFSNSIITHILQYRLWDIMSIVRLYDTWSTAVFQYYPNYCNLIKDQLQLFEPLTSKTQQKWAYFRSVDILSWTFQETLWVSCGRNLNERHVWLFSCDWSV